MKLTSYIAIALAAIATTACSDSGYWEESLPQGEVYAFPKAKAEVLLAATDTIPASYTVEILRNNFGAASTIALNPKFSSEVLSGSDSLTFEAGKNSALYTISINKQEWAIGTSYTASFALDSINYTVAQSANSKFAFTIKQDYTWLEADSALVQSGWVDELAGKYKVAVERAKEYKPENGNILYRLVSPYFVMEPDYAEEGAHLQFILKSNADPVWISPTAQFIGESDDSLGDFYFVMLTSGPYAGEISRDGSVYTLDGLMCSDDGSGLSPYAYETIKIDYTPAAAN